MANKYFQLRKSSFFYHSDAFQRILSIFFTQHLCLPEINMELGIAFSYKYGAKRVKLVSQEHLLQPCIFQFINKLSLFNEGEIVFVQWRRNYLSMEIAEIMMLVLINIFTLTYYMSRRMTKPTKWHVSPAKTQISLAICLVWSESSQCTQ